jgi:hypothetical protein
MLKTSVRKSVSLVIVTVILLSSMLLAGCQPFPYEEGINIVWDFSYLFSKCEIPQEAEMPPVIWYFQPAEFETFPFTTVGELIDLLLGDPESPCSILTDVTLYLRDSSGTRVVPNDSTFAFLTGATETTYLYFGPAPKNGQIIRLTLFGYVFDDGRSCVLWSLDGSRNANANEKCGGEVELVCTVRLVEKELKPDCKDGYDWLGFNIAHDSQWLSWAHEFASKNGNK